MCVREIRKEGKEERQRGRKAKKQMVKILAKSRMRVYTTLTEHELTRQRRNNKCNSITRELFIK